MKPTPKGVREPSLPTIMRILFLGDIVGRPGREAVAKALPRLKTALDLDLVVANGENASGGVGLNARNAAELLAAGCDVLTSGNHIWKHKDIHSALAREERLVRPGNYPPGAPGRGLTVIRTKSGVPVAVLNLLGRTYLENVDCPFRGADALLAEVPEDVVVRLVDFHAEATSEKIALGYYLDGRVSAVIGTHTHVQTNDARVLAGGAACLTDAGMCGPTDSILGMRAETIVQRFVTALPARFEVAEGPVLLHGALIDVDEATGRAENIVAWQDRPTAQAC